MSFFNISPVFPPVFCSKNVNVRSVYLHSTEMYLQYSTCRQTHIFIQENVKAVPNDIGSAHVVLT